ncbi:protein PFC0760c-like isoform X2 [Pararge aegeria]|uniref:protein PFC0760c-like isoform X2 n=1 Tax=Pararge aegeria TaxID=116150 RepID=UPI0019D2793A|nr:protein PFC0760c-like isoform X2 [Pararge aegeria]
MAKTKQVFGEFKCKICTKVFTERAGLAQHIQLHRTDRPFACKKCTYTCKTKKYLNKHIARVHRQATGNECGVCSKKFHFKCQLDKHMYVHTNAKPFKCEVCNKGFNSTYSLSTHRHLHTGAKPFKCSYCEYACRDSSTLRKHRERHTGITRLYQCTACDKTYKTKRVLKVHVAEVHMELDMKTKPCPECGKLFKTVKHLNNHVRQTHQRLYECKCEICGAVLSSKYNMRTHLTTHIDYRPFACGFDGCAKRYKDKQALKKHTIVHYPEKHFVCDVCDKKFTRLHRMYDHKKQHQVKRKSVFCDHCGKGFYNKNYVRSHITRKHMYRQHYICDLCGLLTYNKPSIVMHLKYGHVSEMDRKCKICKKTYKKHLYLKAHYWKTHCIKYKLNKNRLRKSKKPTDSVTDDLRDTKIMHEIKVEPLSENEDVTESTEYSEAVLSEDTNIAMSENRTNAGTAVKKFTDFFIEHIIMPSTSNDEARQKETDVYVDVTSHKEAERVRKEMLKRWRKNGGVKPMKRVKRHFDEKIEITVFSETESDVPISEYKSRINSLKESVTTNDTNNSLTNNDVNNGLVIDQENSEINIPKTEKPDEDDSNYENQAINEINRETSNHNNDKEITSDDVETNLQLSSVNEEKTCEKYEIASDNIKLGECKEMNDEITLENNRSINGKIIKINYKQEKQNVKNDAVASTKNHTDSINNNKDLGQVDIENDIETAIQSNASENDEMDYTNSLAESVKLRKRQCVRKVKKISYRYSDNEEDDDLINNSKRNKLASVSDHYENLTNYQLRLTNDEDTQIQNNNLDKLELAKGKRKSKTNFKMPEDDRNANPKSKETNNEMASRENGETVENVQSNSEVDEINIENHLEERGVRKKRRCVKNSVNTDMNSDGDEEFVPDDETDEEKIKSQKFKLNSHQCYVCFKLYDTKQKLLDHCKEHFDVCNIKMLKKCPLCEFVTNSDLVRHVRLMHKINLNYLYGTLKDRKNNNNRSRFYFNVENNKFNEVEVIPSIKNLNRQAFLKIDRARREKNDKDIKKTKLVKKDGEWIVEKVLINTKKGNYVLPDKVEKELLKGDVNTEKELENGDYCVKMQKLSRIAKKNGQKMLFPCQKCEKICQTFSALKLHIRRHDPNAKPFKKKVWKHKLSAEELKELQDAKEKIKNANANNKNRYEKPKPIIHNHKCDPKLMDFYEKNIKGGDIEFWQFLKIFNKMSRENVNDFPDLENRTEFGNHFYNPDLNTSKESVRSNDRTDLDPIKLASNSGLIPKKTDSVRKKKVVNIKVRNLNNKYKRTILITKMEYIKRKQIKELLRKKNNEIVNI